MADVFFNLVLMTAAVCLLFMLGLVVLGSAGLLIYLVFSGMLSMM